MTILGVLAAFGIAAACTCMLSRQDPAWLRAAAGLAVVHWFSDMLDGTLARFRKVERARYGFHVDHPADVLSTAAIGVGLGRRIDRPQRPAGSGVGLDLHVSELGLTVFDVAGVAGAAPMVGLLGARAVKNLRDLAQDEPSGRRPTAPAARGRLERAARPARRLPHTA